MEVRFDTTQKKTWETSFSIFVASPSSWTTGTVRQWVSGHASIFSERLLTAVVYSVAGFYRFHSSKVVSWILINSKICPQNKQHRSNKNELKSTSLCVCVPKRNTKPQLVWSLFGMAKTAHVSWCWDEKKTCPKSNSAWSTCATCVATRRKHVWALKDQRPPAVTETPRRLWANVTRGNCPRVIGKKMVNKLESWKLQWRTYHVLFTFWIYIYRCLCCRFRTSTDHFRVWLE